MSVVSCQRVKKYHGANLILADVTFELGPGERAGLIGPNGCGKSTLLQILAGVQRHDEGEVSLQKRTQVGYLPQVPVDREGMTVYEVLRLGYREALACQALMTELEQQMATPHEAGDLDRLLRRYAEEQERFRHLGGYEMEAQIQQVAQGLGIAPEWYSRPYATLSGGEQTRVGLASLLLERPTLLLLDEPTNHLDTAGIEWLEGFLGTYTGTCLVVSHDRYFLDRVVTKVIELEDGEGITYLTNYSGYVKEKEERLLLQFAEFKEQQKKIKQMKAAIAQLLEWGRVGDNGKFFRRAASMQKALDRMEMVKRPVLERRTAEFDLQQADRSGREVVKIEGLTKRYGDRTLLGGVDALLAYGERVVLIGQNGTGKSTLFKLLLGQEEPTAGSLALGARVQVGYLAQQDRPDDERTVLQAYCEEARAETGEARSQLARYLFFGADVFKPLKLLSGGEWTRFRLALLVQAKPNLLLLDEPTNHLDIASREALEEALEEFPGTVLAISHDRYFINRLAERVWELAEGALTPYLGNYDAYREERERTRSAPVPGPAAPVEERKGQRPAIAPEREQARQAERAKRVKGQLEQAIAAKEQRLTELEAAAEQAQETGDLAGLNAAWTERETVHAELEQLYAQWLELEEGE